MSTRQPDIAAPTTTAANQSPIGVLLRQYRLGAGLSQEMLAERAGMSVQAISMLENGKRQTPYRHTVAQLAGALNLSAAEAAAFEAAVVRSRRPTRDTPAPVDGEGGVGASLPDGWSPGNAHHNLPRPLTSFVGRTHELDALTALLSSTRLVTLSGAGGCGKTRLVLEVADRVANRYADGVWFVDLAPLSDPALVLPAIAQVLGIREDAARPLAPIVVDAVHARHLLLVLDNCEHLIDGCASVAQILLEACRQLSLVATSREALRVPGEISWRVPSLSLPQPATNLSPTHAAQSEAVRLFMERAIAVQPTFQLTAINVQAVVQICHELDGIPLALELAAARMHVLTTEELAARLDRRFNLLTGGSRTARLRQQTLQATVDWSYDLLTPEEQTLFARLSVFAGGWTLDAAEAVGIGGHIRTEDVLSVLTRLVEQSLVVAQALDDGTTRYRLLETLRLYGRTRLERCGELARVQHQHATFYLTLAERAEPELIGSDQLWWLDELEREHDNLRAALAWWLATAEAAAPEVAASAADAGLRLSSALFWFWFVHDHHAEAINWLDRALAQGTTASRTVRAHALFAAGVFAWSSNDLARSETLLRESLTLSRAAGDRRTRVLALGSLGFALCQGGRDADGASMVEESIAVAHAVGDPWLVAYALLHRLLRVAYGPAIEHADERARARAAGIQAQHGFEAVGDGMSIAQIHLCLGEIAIYDRDYAAATVAFRAAVPLMRAVGWTTSIADGLTRLGDVARSQGDGQDATNLYHEALALYRQSGRRLGANLVPHLPAVLCHLAEMAVEHGALDLAQTYIGECLMILRETQPSGSPQLAEALAVQGALFAAQGARQPADRST